MSVQNIQSELFVELSTEQQQLLSGGKYGGFYGSREESSSSDDTPDITVRGTLTSADGRCFPVRILGFKEDSHS